MADASIPFSSARTRVEAKEGGKRRYFTGVACKHGHICERSAASGGCLECIHVRNTREDRRVFIAAYQQRYLENPVKRARRWEQARTYAKSPNRKARRRQRREDKRIKLAGRPKPKACEICGSTRKVSFDHCHLTGLFRGWLCERCNLVIGMAKDNAALLRLLADYLARHAAANAQIDWITKAETQRVLEKT